MDPHPDFQETYLPRAFALPSFRLTPLSPAQAQEDFEAVTQSTRVLKGLFGDAWPEGLTLEANEIDLAWHEREFTSRRSFAWIVREPGGTYLGCAYIYPDIGRRGHALIVIWVRDRPERTSLTEQLRQEFGSWLTAALPRGIRLRWAG